MLLKSLPSSTEHVPSSTEQLPESVLCSEKVQGRIWPLTVFGARRDAVAMIALLYDQAPPINHSQPRSGEKMNKKQNMVTNAPWAVVLPRRGRLLLFPHLCPHEGLATIAGPKLLLRGEAY